MIEVKDEQDYGRAFSAMDDARTQPIILPAGPTFLRDRAVIARIARAPHSVDRGNAT
jgi:hypothetical protein